MVQNFQETFKLCDKPNITEIHDVAAIAYDHASSNTGERGGLGALLAQERQKSFESVGKSVALLPPLMTVGCFDHKTALIAREFSFRIALQLQRWGFHELCLPGKSPTHVVGSIVKHIMGVFIVIIYLFILLILFYFGCCHCCHRRHLRQ